MAVGDFPSFGGANLFPSSLSFGPGTTADQALGAGLKLGQAGGGAATTAAKAGLFANPVGLALAGGQLALSIGSMIAKDKAATQQAYSSAYNTSYQNFMQNHAIRMRNERRKEMFQAKLDMVRDQIANNNEAAQASYVAEQYRLNEIYDQAAFKQADMIKTVG